MGGVGGLIGVRGVPPNGAVDAEESELDLAVRARGRPAPSGKNGLPRAEAGMIMGLFCLGLKRGGAGLRRDRTSIRALTGGLPAPPSGGRGGGRGTERSRHERGRRAMPRRWWRENGEGE